MLISVGVDASSLSHIVFSDLILLAVLRLFKKFVLVVL